MTLTELRYIIAVAQEKHFGRAAAACFVSQPTLSVSIKKLEDELNTRIFERKSNQIALTTVGERLVKQAQLIVEESNKMRLIADQGRDPLLGPLRLGVIFTIGPYLLPKIVKVIFDAVPNMPLVLTEDFTTAILEKLRNGSLDVGILAEPFDMHACISKGSANIPTSKEPLRSFSRIAVVKSSVRTKGILGTASKITLTILGNK